MHVSSLLLTGSLGHWSPFFVKEKSALNHVMLLFPLMLLHFGTYFVLSNIFIISVAGHTLRVESLKSLPYFCPQCFPVPFKRRCGHATYMVIHFHKLRVNVFADTWALGQHACSHQWLYIWVDFVSGIQKRSQMSLRPSSGWLQYSFKPTPIFFLKIKVFYKSYLMINKRAWLMR